MVICFSICFCIFSGTQTSRPTSSSKRRKKPSLRNIDKLKPLTKYSSDDYDSSESEGIYSDEDSTENVPDLNAYEEDVNGTTNGLYRNDDEIAEAGDNTNMHPSLRRRTLEGQTLKRPRPSVPEVTDIVDGPDGKRTVGIQAVGPKHYKSDLNDLDGGLTSADLGTMVTSPISVWNSNDRSETESQSDRNSTASGGVVKKNLSDLEKSMNQSMTPTPRSDSRSSGSFSTNMSNLEKGPTEMWSTSLSDLRPLPNFCDDLSFVMETEGMYPSGSPLEYSNTQSGALASVFMRTPREGVRLIPRPDCSTPNNAGQIVNISFPESQLQQTGDLSEDTPVKFEVTVHEDNTNIVYNVEKTEYRTYRINSNGEEQRVLPESIAVKLTETNVNKSEEKIENKSEETLRLQRPDTEQDCDSLVLERSFRSTASLERECNFENGDRSDNATELREENETNSAYFVPSQKDSQKNRDRKKIVTLQSSGVVAATSYPNKDSGISESPAANYDDLGASFDDSDYTSDYGTITSVDGKKAFVSFTSDSEDNEIMKPDLSPGVSPRASHVSLCPEFKYKNLPVQNEIPSPSDNMTSAIPVHSQKICAMNDISTSATKAGETDIMQHSVLNALDNDPTCHDEEPETDTSSVSTVRHIKSIGENTCCSQETLDDVETVVSGVDTQSEIGTSVPRLDLSLSPNRSPKKLDRETGSSSDDIYHSVDQSETNTSTSSSDYKTPQQSPRYMNCAENIVPKQVEDVVIPDFCDDELLQSTPRQTQEESLVLDQAPALTSSPKRVNDVRTVSVNTESVPTVLQVAPLATSKVAHIFGRSNDPVQTEALRQKLEKKMENLQHHVRSLSDSAISSDYTDGDSVSLSPRASRVYDIDKRHGDRRVSHLDNPHRVYQIGQVMQPFNNDDSPAKKLSFKDSGNVFDAEEIDTEQLGDMGSSLSVTKVTKPPPKQKYLPASTVGKFPETLLGTLLAIKPYPLQRSVSLDSLSSILNINPLCLRAARNAQSIDEIQPGYGDDGNQIEETRTPSPGEIPFFQNLVDGVSCSTNVKKVYEKSTSLDMIGTVPERDYLRSLSENDIEDFTEGHDSSNTSNDSITFVFIGDDQSQRKQDDSDKNDRETSLHTASSDNSEDEIDASLNTTGSEESPNNAFRPVSPGEIIGSNGKEELEHSGSVFTEMSTEDEEEPSNHTASEEINAILHKNIDITPDDVSSEETFTETSDDLVQNNRIRFQKDDDSEPLRHRFGIDESVLPIPDRSVSADNLPRHLTLLNDIRRSRSAGLLNVGVNDEQESESGIFPPRNTYADESPTDKSISFRTNGGTDQDSARTGSQFGGSEQFESDNTNSDDDGEDDDDKSAIVRSIGSKASSTEDFKEEFLIEYSSNKDRFKYTTLPSSESIDVDPQGFHEQEHLRQVLEAVQKLIMPKPATHDLGIGTNDDENAKFVSVSVQTDESNVTLNTLDSNMLIQPDHIILPALAAPFRSQSMESFGLGTSGNTLELSEGQRNWCTLGELMVETTELLRRINDRLPEWERQPSLSASEEHQARGILKKWHEISVQTGGSLTNLNTVGLQAGDGDVDSLDDIKPLPYEEATQIDTEPLKQNSVTTKAEVPPTGFENTADMTSQTECDTSTISEAPAHSEDRPLEENMLEVCEKPNFSVVMPHAYTQKYLTGWPEDEAKESLNKDDEAGQKSVSSRPPQEEILPAQNAQQIANSNPDTSFSGTYLDFLPHLMAKLGLDQAYTQNNNTSSNEPSDQIQEQQESKDSPLTRTDKLTGKFLPQMMQDLQEKHPNTVVRSNQDNTLPTNQASGGDKQPSGNQILPGFTLPNMSEIEELRKEHAKLMENLKKASEKRKARKDALKARKQIPPGEQEKGLFTENGKPSVEPPKDSKKTQLKGQSNIDPDSSLDENNSSYDSDKVLSDEDEVLKSDTEVVRSDDDEEERTSDVEPVQSDENDEQRPIGDPIHSNENDEPFARSSVSSAASAPELVQISIQVDPSTGLVVENKTYKDGSQVKPKGTTQKRLPKARPNQKPQPTHEHTWEMTGDELKAVWEKKPEPTTELEHVTPVNTSLEQKPTIEADTSNTEDNEVIDDVLGDDILVPGQEMPPLERREDEVRSPSPEEELIVPLVHTKDHHLHPLFQREQRSPVPVEEEYITPQTYKRDHSVPPSFLKGYDTTDSTAEKFPREHELNNSNALIPIETIPMGQPPFPREQKSISPGQGQKSSNEKYISSKEEQDLQPALKPNKDTSLRAPPGFTDDATQMSVSYSNTETQTEPELPSPAIEEQIVPESKKPVEAPKPVETPAAKVEPPQDKVKCQKEMKEELEKLQKEKQHILDLLGLSGVPNSVTVELLEAKLNYCIGQTDMLLENLDNIVPEGKKKPTTEEQKTKDYITKYREDLKKSKADIEECQKQLRSPSSRGRGAGRGRTLFRRSDFLNQQRQAQIEAFKLERMREQQDYEKSHHGTPSKTGTPHKGNTPLFGNSPVVTPRSDRSRDSSPSYSPGYMTPREHRAHLIDLRRQLINNVVEEEQQHSRSCSPQLLRSPQASTKHKGAHRSPQRSPQCHHPVPARHRTPSDQSLGFSPQVSVSFPGSRRSSSTDSPSPFSTYVVPPDTGKQIPEARPGSSDRLFGRPPRSPCNSYTNSPDRGAAQSRIPELDTVYMSEDIYSEVESAKIAKEVEEAKKRSPNMSAEMEEMLRRSSFSSASSQR